MEYLLNYAALAVPLTYLAKRGLPLTKEGNAGEGVFGVEDGATWPTHTQAV